MTSELILYLEPSRSSTLWCKVQAFFKACQREPWSKDSWNEAMRYPVHITIVGFFNDPSSSDPGSIGTGTSTSGHPQGEPTIAAKHIIGYLDRQIKKQLDPLQISNNSVSSTTFLQGLIRPNPVSLLIGIQPSQHLLQLVKCWKDEFPELGLRLKKINHLSLCYWVDEEEVSEDLRQQREEWIDRTARLAHENIPMLGGSLDTNESWDVVLYSVQNRDKRQHCQPYPLVELARWTLP